MDNYKKAWHDLPENLQEILKKHNAFLAGGAVLAGILGTKINDYDFYFSNPTDCADCIESLKGIGAVEEFKSDNATTLKVFDKFKIQCISKLFGDNYTILNSFDFLFCQVGYNPATDELLHCDWNFEDIKYHQNMTYKGSFQGNSMNELYKVQTKNYDADINPSRVLKYFAKNLIRISPDSVIKMLLNSKVKVPGWLIAKSKNLWLLDTGWQKNHVGDLIPPKDQNEKSFFNPWY